MPRERISMRKIKEIFRLKWENGLSNRKIAMSCCISRSTVAVYISKAQQVGLTYSVCKGMDETEIERLLFPSSTTP